MAVSPCWESLFLADHVLDKVYNTMAVTTLIVIPTRQSKESSFIYLFIFILFFLALLDPLKKKQQQQQQNRNTRNKIGGPKGIMQNWTMRPMQGATP